MAVTAAVLGFSAAASAQATIGGAEAYKLEFENDHVRIERAHYPAATKVESHAHPPSNTVYVYLNDSEGVIFRHTAGASHTVTRQPVKTGSIRISGGGSERHEAENTSKTASDFLRVILKTQPAGRSGGRMAPTDLQFSSGQIRITRATVAPHQSITLGGDAPSVVIEVPSGTPRWLDAGARETFDNHGARDQMLVRIELLTRPR